MATDNNKSCGVGWKGGVKGGVEAWDVGVWRKLGFGKGGWGPFCSVHTTKVEYKWDKG